MAASILLCAGYAQAADWYVDRINGSDANDGQSPQTAWQTITHAVSQVPTGAERIWIAPGTYSAVSGEVFPIEPKPGHQLVGVQGSSRPIIAGDNSPGSVLLRFESSASQPQVFGADTLVEHLDLRRAWHCVDLIAEAGEVSPTFVDVRFERMVWRGVEISGLGGLCKPTFDRSFFGVTEPASNSFGIVATGAASTPQIEVTVRDSTFTESGGGGVVSFGSVDALLERCNFDGLGLAAIGAYSRANAPARLRCFDSVVTYCDQMIGLVADTTLLDASFTRCTIANQTVMPPISAANLTGALQLSVDSSILSTWGPSFGPQGVVSIVASHSMISDGSFDGVNGCFSGGAEFRDEEGGDFRLHWASPCIDAASSNAPAGSRDLLGALRNVDGDLDAVGRTDIGAYEFTPLELVSTGAIGSTLRLDNWGPNSPSLIYWARAGLAAPAATPFGVFQLDSQLARTFKMTTAGAFQPSVTQRMIPNDIALVGHTFSFQALTNSSAAPLSRALSNGVEVLITP